jgi:hypothetical protein
MKREPQWQSVLRELRIRPRGIHTFELRSLNVANPSERIRQLEGKGHVIRHDRERLHGDAFGVRYVLVHDAERQEAA